MGLFQSIKELFTLKKSIIQKTNELTSIEQRIADANSTISDLETLTKKVIGERDAAVLSRDAELSKTREEVEQIISDYAANTVEAKRNYDEAQERLNDILKKVEDGEGKISRQKDVLRLIRKLQKHMYEILDRYSGIEPVPTIAPEYEDDIIELAPSLEIPLHSMDVKSLRTLSKDNNKIIEDTLKRYEKRYTTKANRAIYQLMVIALRAELQNILIGMKFASIDKCKSSFKNMIEKYMKIAADGNKVIAPTLQQFISEIEILFEKSIDIEYEYYIKKEQERAEQQALREQMRQEAEERKELERQQKQIEKEEAKFKQEIESINVQMDGCSDDILLQQLQEKIKILTQQLQEVEEQKEEIIKLQNGKAGYVYVISNLGSFGENRFKIGMTRRMDPMDRINELGSASVPFKFDVHSFIFSDDAVGLEHSLHERLNEKRTNKINLRKEFFDLSIDELETLVQELDPTAEFNRTMLAIEYRKTLEMNNAHEADIA